MACGGDRARRINPRRDPAAGEAPSQAQMRMAATAQAKDRANRERTAMAIYRHGAAWFVRSADEGPPPVPPTAMPAVLVDVYSPDPVGTGPKEGRAEVIRDPDGSYRCACGYSNTSAALVFEHVDKSRCRGAQLGAIHREPLPPVPAEQIAEGRDEAAGSSPAGVYGIPIRVDPSMPPDEIEMRSGGDVIRMNVRTGAWLDPLDDVRACAREALTVIGRARILSGSMAQGDREALTSALDAFDLARNRSRAGLAPKEGPR